MAHDASTASMPGPMGVRVLGWRGPSAGSWDGGVQVQDPGMAHLVTTTRPPAAKDSTMEPSTSSRRSRVEETEAWGC